MAMRVTNAGWVRRFNRSFFFGEQYLIKCKFQPRSNSACPRLPNPIAIRTRERRFR